MRLLHLSTLELHEFDGDPPPYAITSHRWTKQEVTFQELSSNYRSETLHQKAGYKKIVGFQKAILDLISKSGPQLKVQYFWIDTCCIDKTNSVELQEALNSMFRYYAEAEVCLAYLHDVPSLDAHPNDIVKAFKASEWFTRGWTLQELLAPRRLVFCNEDWAPIGRKRTTIHTPWMTARGVGVMPLNELISDVTKIPEDVLENFKRHVEKYSIEERRSWMKGRSTTRKEDQVYCQLGIFGVFMPLIYDEGDHAMIRLEEAIEQKRKRIDARVASPAPIDNEAPSPVDFALRGKIRTFTVYYPGILAIDFSNSYWKRVETSVHEVKTVQNLIENILLHMEQTDPRYRGHHWRLRYHQDSSRFLRPSSRVAEIPKDIKEFDMEKVS